MKFLLVFLLLFAITDARIAVVQSRTSNLPFAEGMVARLNEFAECKRYGVEEKSGLLQIAATKPDIFVILSTLTAEKYVRLIREGETLPPHFTIPDTPLREEDIAILTRHGIVCIPSASPTPVIRALSGRLNTSTHIGYIYSNNSRNIAEIEMAQLRAENIPVFGRLLRTPILPDEFAYGIGRFFTNNVLLYRFCGKDPILSFFEQEPPMISFVERRASAVIVDSPEYIELFTQIPVVLFGNNNALIERIAALIAFAVLKDSETEERPRFSHPIRIYTTNATLYSKNTPNGENLIEGAHLILAQIDRMSQQLRRQEQSTEDLWKLYISTLGAIIDTSTITSKNSMIILKRNVIIDKFDQIIGTREFGYAALAIIVLLLFILFCLTFVKAYKKKLYKRRVALLMPGSVSKIQLVSDDGKSVPLSILLENEGYQTKLTSSLKGFQRIMRKSFPNIVVADWEASRVMLQLFYQEFTNSHKYSQVGVILINIPVNKQTQVKKLFGGASVYCYDDFPTLDDVQAHLRGDKHFSSYSEGSYMSGIIQEDNLTAVLQMLEGNMYTGCLVVEDDKPVSVIYFKGGRVVYAVDKSGESGVKSIYNALNCRRGNFYFHLNRTAQTETLNLGTIEILMGWADQRDRIAKKISDI